MCVAAGGEPKMRPEKENAVPKRKEKRGENGSGREKRREWRMGVG